MWVVEGIVAGFSAGIIMAAVSEALWRMGLMKSNLVLIGGSFAARRFAYGAGPGRVYALGALIHLVTSAGFGLVYAVIARLAGFDPVLWYAVAPYVFFLWLAMLFVALPAAGRGRLGREIGPFAWAEQLLLHTVFGLAFWWALGLVS